MIEILTLFLGLYSGPQAVEVRVGETVVAVVLELDGERVATRDGPPWVLGFDLGDELVPRRLEAVAYDRDSAEIGRARRWIHRGAAADGDGLTAVAVTLVGRRRLPPPALMSGWFLDPDGKPLEVVHSERGAATVVAVEDAAAQTFLDQTRSLHAAAATPDRQYKQHRFLRLDDQATLRFISPRAPPPSRIRRGMEIFSSTQAAAAGGDGLLWHAARMRPMRFRQRISDAVAVAGLEAHASGGRRAVWLLTATATDSFSRYPEQQVRRLLADLQVPLVVWAFEPRQPPVGRRSAAEQAEEPWTPTRRIRLPRQLRQDLVADYVDGLDLWFREDLARELDRQRIVWLRGNHLPHDLRLSAAAAGIRWTGRQEE